MKINKIRLIDYLKANLNQGKIYLYVFDSFGNLLHGKMVDNDSLEDEKLKTMRITKVKKELLYDANFKCDVNFIYATVEIS